MWKRMAKASAVLVMAGLTTLPLASVSGAQSAHSPKEPTLGLAGPWKQYFGLGFGLVKPRTIYTGGEATNQVRKIHWDTWGEGRAVGHGKALYANSGPVSGYPSLSATVIAFHLGICGGHPAYQRFEWYFPSKHQSFNPARSLPTCTTN